MEEFKGPFPSEVSRALKHIKSAVAEYGAHYGFVICLGYDSKIWYGSTSNVTGSTLQLHKLSPLLARHLRAVSGKVAPILGCEHICSIFGAGQKERAKQNTFGIRNKALSFARISSKLEEEDPSGQYPVVAILSYKDKKYHIIHPNPDRYPQMGEVKEHIVRTMTLAEKNIRGNYLPLDAYNVGNVSPHERPESSQEAPVSSRSHLKRGLKRRKPVEQPHIPSIEARKSGLAEGT